MNLRFNLTSTRLFLPRPPSSSLSFITKPFIFPKNLKFKSSTRHFTHFPFFCFTNLKIPTNNTQNQPNNNEPHIPLNDSNATLQHLRDMLTSSQLMTRDNIKKLLEKYVLYIEKTRFFDANNLNINESPLHEVVGILLIQRLESFSADEINLIYKFIINANNTRKHFKEFMDALCGLKVFLDVDIKHLKEIFCYCRDNLDPQIKLGFTTKLVEQIESREQILSSNQLIELMSLANLFLSPNSDDIWNIDVRVENIGLRNLKKFNNELQLINANNLVELFYIFHKRRDQIPQIAKLLPKLEDQLLKCYNIISTDMIVKLVHTLATLGNRDSELLSKVNEDILIKMHYISTHHLLHIMNCCAQLGVGSDDLYSDADARISANLESFNPNILPEILFSFATIGKSFKKSASYIENTLKTNINIYTINDLIKLYWSVVLAMNDYSQELIDIIESKITSKCYEINDIQYMCILWDALMRLDKINDKNALVEHTKPLLVKLFDKDFQYIKLDETYVANLFFGCLKYDYIKDMQDIIRKYILYKMNSHFHYPRQKATFMNEIIGLLLQHPDYLESCLDICKTYFTNANEMINDDTVNSDLKHEIKLLSDHLIREMRYKQLL